MNDLFASTCKILIENLPDGIVFSDSQGSVLYSNKSFALLLGYPLTSQVVGTSLVSLVHPNDVEKMREFLAQVVQFNQQSRAIQLFVTGYDGVEHWVEMQSAQIATDLGAFIVVKDLTSYKALQDELLLQALTDELTGLYNRRGFRMMAEQELNHTQRLENQAILLSIDIDAFKAINDTYGHVRGDLVLKIVASTLKHTFRNTDVIGRWGGDEFLVLALDAPVGTVDVLINRFNKSLHEASISCQAPLFVNATIGTAYSEAEVTLEQLIHQADRAMYAKKPY